MLNSAYATALGTTGRHLCAAASAPRNAIAAILTPADILLDVDVPTKNRAFEEIAKVIAAPHGLVDGEVQASLVEREKIGSTAVGHGFAIPHARVRGLPQPIAAFVRLKCALDFDAPDGKPVSDILCLLVPRHATEAHLLLLAEVAEMICDKSFREHVRSCGNAAEVHAAFTRWRQV